jgi:ferredoxin
MAHDEKPKTTRPPSGYRIEVVRRRCTGVGTCVEKAPRTFDLDDDAVAYVRKANGDDDGKILAAAQACPQDAILVFDVATGQRIWPQEGG